MIYPFCGVNSATKEILKNANSNSPIPWDKNNYYYIYHLKTRNINQIGVVALTSTYEYQKKIIKKHEKIIDDVVGHYKKSLLTDMLQISPLLLVHLNDEKIQAILHDLTNKEADFFWIAKDHSQHSLWVIQNQNDINRLQDAYNGIDCLYIADGHHRYEAASQCSTMLGKDYKLMAYIIAELQTQILSNHRLISLVNINKETLLKKLFPYFEIQKLPSLLEPEGTELGMFFEEIWYKLKPKPILLNKFTLNKQQAIFLLQEFILKIILNEYISGPIRFFHNLDSFNVLTEAYLCGKQKVIGFTVPPLTIDLVIKSADIGVLYPANTTCFNPKPLNGMIYYYPAR